MISEPAQPWGPTFGRATLLVLSVLLSTACDAPERGASEEGLQPGSAPQHAVPASNQRMARRIALAVESSPPMDNPFRNEERLQHLLAQKIPSDPADSVRSRLQRAEESLRSGLSEKAAQAFAEVLAEVEAQPALHPAGLAQRVRSMLATSHLRAGEQANCLEHAGADACLLPIQGDGLHRDTSGSKAAMEALEPLLENPDDLTSRWLYNIAAMTLGQYPDAVPERWRIPATAFDSEADLGRFPNVAASAGLDTVGLAGGCVVDDLDGDGHLDVLVSSWGLTDPLRFLHNPGSTAESTLRFVDRSREAGLAELPGGLNLVHADYDNDGDLDVLVLRGAWLRRQGRLPNSLLRNDGQGRFEDVTERSGLLGFHPTQTAAWADFDNDGWLDLYIGNESSAGEPHPNQLYRNLGAEGEGEVRFVEVAKAAGVQAGGMVKGVAWGDVDNDGWQDLYLSRHSGRNLLYRNLGPGLDDAHPRFEEIARHAGVELPENSFPTWFFDYDNDGWLDLFAGGFSRSFTDAQAHGTVAEYLGFGTGQSAPRLYRNRGDGTFEDRTVAAGLQRNMLIMGAGFGDLDNDGWLDLYAGTGAPDFRVLVPNRMFRNDRGLRFLDLTTSGGFGHLQKGHGIAFADLDNDGDQDVLAVMGGAFAGDTYQDALFVNPGHGGRWLTLRLQGRRANRSALGARLKLELSTPEGRREIHTLVSSGGSFGSASLQQEIGLGDATAVTRLEVWWPGSDKQVFTDLPLDRILRLVEGNAKPEVLDLPVLRLAHHPQAAHHHAHDH